MTPSQSLAAFAARLKFDHLESAVVDTARRHILDTIGVGLRGAREGMARKARAGVVALPGAPGSVPVWGANVGLAAPYAALANGVASHALDFDDTHTAAIVHGSAILVATVFAMADELDLSGAELITAFVAGWEVAARVGLASRGTLHDRGYHTSSAAGVFGAATAAAKLLGLNEEKISHAIALAGSQASGINEYQADGSSAKIFHIGWAAHAGIVAAYLAKAGMTGPASIFEGRYGFLNAYGDIRRSDIGKLTEGLAVWWESARISIKPYPCCHLAHAFIECADRIRRQGVDPDHISRIECVIDGLGSAMICEPQALKKRPPSAYAAKFSLPFLVAVTLTFGKAAHATGSNENLHNGKIIDLAARVAHRIAEPGEIGCTDSFPGWVVVHLNDGRRFEERLEKSLGSPGNPLPRHELEEKFLGNAVGPGIRAGAMLAMLNALEHTRIRDFRTLLRAA